ncbi:hypothetical protein [Aestuariivivens sediminis]|uniref:hypothetical protein n=1 Tax=Aestuariivivens sediminis TaxID=2913557 RepID=UPI001F594D38|nr:hypothetical protein [Aestuariivivens sediminis]
MGEKKHIDRLFQEKFKDFEVSPRPEVWNSIESRLRDKKKKRRIIPIWLPYGGVAALLAVLLTMGYLYFNSSKDAQNPLPQVVDTESTIENSSRNEATPAGLYNKPSNEAISGTEEQLNLNQEKGTENSGHSESTTHPLRVLPPSPHSVVESPVTSNEHVLLEKSQTPHGGTDNSTSEEILAKENSTRLAKATRSTSQQDGLDNLGNNPDNSGNPNTLIDNITTADSTVVAKNNSNTAAEEQEELSLEDIINTDLKERIEEEKFNRWSVAPNAAPVYFNSLGEGSSIDPQLSNNAKTGELNMSYGIRASYAVNKKLQIRSGINRVRLGYNTNDVVVYQSIGSRETPNSASFANIKYDSGYSLTTISSASTTSFAGADNINFKSSAGLLSSATDTSINQEFGYIEIPLEIQYAVLDKKFGLNLIGGFSSFFLNENKIYSENNSSKTFLGRANNINKVSYSANFGLGLNYKMSKRLDFNLEPLFKYQINTFSNTSGNFKPYFIGVYTGFAIKF